MQDTSTSGKKQGKAEPKHSEELPLLIDPVCGMDLEESASDDSDSEKVDYKGTTYYFCSEECRKQFESNPQQFVG